MGATGATGEGEHITVRNQTRGTVVCAKASVAHTSLTRLFGLLGKRRLAPGTGLLICPSSGVHTWGMRFPIDIVALDREHRILGLWQNVGPWRVRGLHPKTRSVLEMAAGALDASESQRGDQLLLSPATEAGLLIEAHPEMWAVEV